jgi:hypothetical protein
MVMKKTKVQENAENVQMIPLHNNQAKKYRALPSNAVTGYLYRRAAVRSIKVPSLAKSQASFSP